MKTRKPVESESPRVYSSITMQALDPPINFEHSSKPLRQISKHEGAGALSCLARFNAQQQSTSPAAASALQPGCPGLSPAAPGGGPRVDSHSALRTLAR